MVSVPAYAGSGGLGTEATPAAKDGVFPVDGRHAHGDGLGAGRGHQGQDLLAKCGRPVVASQPGRVKVVDFQGSGAGNYVVVRGKGKKAHDYVYMHMLRRPAVSEGEKVTAGQRIGLVGSTGRSSACHLHFEMWSRPGWYQGGSVVNPKRYLNRWERRRRH